MKVTKAIVEIALNDLAEEQYFGELLDDEDVHSYKVLKCWDEEIKDNGE